MFEYLKFTFKILIIKNCNNLKNNKINLIFLQLIRFFNLFILFNLKFLIIRFKVNKV